MPKLTEEERRPRNKNGKFRDIQMIGKIFGRWTVLSRYKKAVNGNMKWICRCECGTLKAVRGDTLRGRNSVQCRQCKHTLDNTQVQAGDIFGELTVISETPRNKGIRHLLCLCSCGTISEIPFYAVLSGKRDVCEPCSYLTRWDNNPRKIPNGFTRYQWKKSQLLDCYVRECIYRGSILKAKHIPQSLIEAKRLELKMKRYLKEQR